MPLINIPSKSARRGTGEPELHFAKGEGRRKPEKHYRDNFVTAFRRDQARQARTEGEFCILRLCSIPRGVTSRRVRPSFARDEDEGRGRRERKDRGSRAKKRSSHSNFCVLSFSLQSGPYVSEGRNASKISRDRTKPLGEGLEKRTMHARETIYTRGITGTFRKFAARIRF